MTGELKGTFRTNLRAAMDREPGLTQEKLAQELGVSVNTVEAWMYRGSEPKGRQLVALTMRFSESAEWFFTDHTIEKDAA